MEGRVYFIRSENGLVKIGHTSGDALLRLANLQTGSPVTLSLEAFIYGGRKLETELHREFRHLLNTGEWFTPDDALNELILLARSNPRCRELKPRRSLMTAEEMAKKRWSQAGERERAIERMKKLNDARGRGLGSRGGKPRPKVKKPRLTEHASTPKAAKPKPIGADFT